MIVMSDEYLIRIRAAMRVIQPKIDKYNYKPETAFRYAVLIRNRTRFERLIKKMNIGARRKEMRLDTKYNCLQSF